MSLTLQQLTELTRLANKLSVHESDIVTATDMLQRAEQAAAVARAEYATLHKKFGIKFHEQPVEKVESTRISPEESRALKSSLMQVLVSHPGQKFTIGEILAAADISYQDHMLAKSAFQRLKTASQETNRPIHQEGMAKRDVVYWIEVERALESA